MKRKYLVIGGAGFIGSRLVKHLCDSGDEVIVVDDLSFGMRSLVDSRSQFIQCSMRDLASYRREIRGCSAAFLLAARSIITTSYTNPLSYIDTNITDFSVSLLEIIRAEIPQVVFSSSASVYGYTDTDLITEATPKQPMTVYGATKSAGEELLAGFYGAYGLNSVALRYFNAYGPNDLQEPVTRAVPAWIRAGLLRQPIELFWGGEQVRDYVFVDDIARAHIACLNTIGHVRYNIGTGKGVRMADLVGCVERALGTTLNVIHAGERRGDPMRLVASNDLVRNRTGWTPQVSLEDGMAQTVDFYRKAIR